MVAFAELKTTAFELYNDAENRPQKVSEFLLSVGADKLVSRIVDESKAEKVVMELSSLSTFAGLSEKKAILTELAAPYIEKAGCADGRKQLLEETKELAAPYVAPYVDAVSEKKTMLSEKVAEKITVGKEMAAPYLSSVKESSAPYVAKIEELRRSERVEAMIEAFKEAREHPAEKVNELKAKAVDLIKYDSLVSYRDYVMSADFQADTTRLVKVDLPAVAKDASSRGALKVKECATKLADEIEVHKAKVKALVAHGYETASKIELEALAAKIATSSSMLLKELQVELSLGVEQFKAEGFSMNDVLERLKRVGAAAVVEGKSLLTPKIEEAEAAEAEEEAATVAAAEEAAKKIVSEAVSESGSEVDESYEDAVEPTAASAAPSTEEA